MTTLKDQKLSRADALWLLFWLATEFVACLYLSHGRQLWSDEIFGRMLIRDPSFSHMLFAWRSGADGGGIFFYIAARIWFFVFGDSAIALRLLTAFGMWVALVLTWITARRWYRLEIVAFCLPFCWLTAHSILRQLMIGRFYGMLLATTASVVYCYGLSTIQRQSKRLLISTFLSNWILVGTHPFGLVYSGALLLATIIFDAATHVWRPRLYIAALAGWTILWPSLAALHASAANGKPHFWTTPPTLDDLQNALVFWTDELQWLWAIFFVAIISVAIARKISKPEIAYERNAPAWIAGFSLMAVIPLLWLISLGKTSYFVDRYLIATIIGAALLQCAAISTLLRRRRARRHNSLLCIAIAASAAGSIYSFFVDIPQNTEPPHEYTNTMASLLPPGMPVVIERVDIFAEAVVANPDHQWRYLLDWQMANAPNSPRGEVSGFHEMENWKHVGYYADRIQPSSEFLTNEPEFFVVADPKELWFDKLIAHNPAYHLRRIGQFSRETALETIWHVQRVQR